MQCIEALGLIPATFIAWWAQVDSNHRPRAYQARALTTWAMSPFSSFGVSRLSSPIGGDDGVRTHDPLLAGQVLSQLSYTPIFSGFSFLNDLWSLKIEQQVKSTRIRARSLRLSFWFCSISRLRSGNHSMCFPITFSIERRWSSRTFRYGYLVTT